MTRHVLGLHLGQPGARQYRRYLSEHMFEDEADIDVFDVAQSHLQSQAEAANS